MAVEARENKRRRRDLELLGAKVCSSLSLSLRKRHTQLIGDLAQWAFFKIGFFLTHYVQQCFAILFLKKIEKEVEAQTTVGDLAKQIN